MRAFEPFLSLCLSVDLPGKAQVLRNAFLQMRKGEILGLVGQSGAGKSTLALAILRLLELKGGKETGTLNFQGHDLMRLSEREMRCIRGRDIGMVLQSPLSALNPALRIETQLREAWRAHKSGEATECGADICDALERVSLSAEEGLLKRYPSQLSIGQAQRVLIAMAILHRPAMIIADEPTSALDVITQDEILRLFRDLNRSQEVAILYISHDLLSVASICQRVAILHDGEIVECAPTANIFTVPQHPYTRQLINAVPRLTFDLLEDCEAEMPALAERP